MRYRLVVCAVVLVSVACRRKQNAAIAPVPEPPRGAESLTKPTNAPAVDSGAPAIAASPAPVLIVPPSPLLDTVTETISEGHLHAEFPALAAHVPAAARVGPKLHEIAVGGLESLRVLRPGESGTYSRTCSAHVVTEQLISVTCESFNGVVNVAAAAKGMGGNANPILTTHNYAWRGGAFQELSLGELFGPGVAAETLVRTACSEVAAEIGAGDAGESCHPQSFALSPEGLRVLWLPAEMLTPSMVVIPWRRLESSLLPGGAAKSFAWALPDGAPSNDAGP